MVLPKTAYLKAVMINKQREISEKNSDLRKAYAAHQPADIGQASPALGVLVGAVTSPRSLLP